MLTGRIFCQVGFLSIAATTPKSIYRTTVQPHLCLPRYLNPLQTSTLAPSLPAIVPDAPLLDVRGIYTLSTDWTTLYRGRSAR